MMLLQSLCRASRVCICCAPLAVAGCNVGPKYVKPASLAPAAYKNSTPAENATRGVDWTKALPDDAANRGAWWTLFGDPALDGLEAKADTANLNVQAADASFQQARFLVRQARSSLYPTVQAGADAGIQRVPAEQLGNPSTKAKNVNQFELDGAISWEPDLWGRVHKQVEGQAATAQASAADAANVRLEIHAELAADYFLACGLDEQARLYRKIVANDEQTLELTRQRLAFGVSSQVDVKQAEAQLNIAQAQARDLGVQRAQYEDAIAVLVGAPAPAFTLPECAAAAQLPQIPPGVPSALLERRPDVASAERKMAEANAQIGLAKTAYYPSLPLTASGGVSSNHLSDLIDWPNRVWSLGGSATELLFDGGSRKAQVSGAKAAYDATVANYRQSVLTAFQEVQDNLSATSVLAAEAATQASAVAASQTALDLTGERLQHGTASALDQMSAHNAVLANQQSAASIRTRQMTTAVQLIKALGGGWQQSQLPTTRQLR